MAIKRTRMTDVAKKAGVSQTTVSFVLNGIEAGLPEQTKQRVLEAARELNYSPNSAARRLASRRSRAIGFALYDIAYISDCMTGAATITASAYAAAEMQGHQLIVYTTHERQSGGEDVETYFAVPIRSKEVDGVVVWDSYVSDDQLTSGFHDGLPLVTVDREIDDVPSVIPDYSMGIEEAMGLMLSRGHQRFALLHAGAFHRDALIRTGFDLALRDKGIPESDAIIMRAVDYTGNLRERIKTQLDELMALPHPPTALVCGDGRTALYAQVDLKERGVRVPEEMALVSCTQVPIATHPLVNLTCLDTHLDMMGRHAIDMVLRMVRGENLAGTRIVIRPDLAVRGTV